MHPEYGLAHGMAFNGITTVDQRDIKVKENGDLYYEEHGFKAWFGIDGLEDTNHIYRRGVKWERLQDNFREYIKAGGDADWQFIPFSWNKHQLDAARELATKEGFDKFTILDSVRGEKE